MPFLVHMRVELPPGMPAVEADDIKAREKAHAQQLQRDGAWQHLRRVVARGGAWWRVVDKYANYSVFDAPSNDALHQMLATLPLFPYMRTHVTPLARHRPAVN